MFELQQYQEWLGSIIEASYRLGMFELQHPPPEPVLQGYPRYRLGMFELQHPSNPMYTETIRVIAWACLSCNQVVVMLANMGMMSYRLGMFELQL